MSSEAPAIRRLGIPEYNWWNEALHGVARAGIATVFPQASGLASTWNPDLIYRMAEAISDEARAKHHEAVRKGMRALYAGLTFWSPNVNIFRDPRWGRGQETYGEDPYLTARLAVKFVQGMQGTDLRYLKVVATPKHFAVHSGPEKERHSFNAQVSQRDLRMTYLPAFRSCIVEGQTYSIMGAYNRVNGEACCASPTLLQKILRDEWGFQGYVVSDCGAIHDICTGHRLVNSTVEAAALAVRNGCDLELGPHAAETLVMLGNYMGTPAEPISVLAGIQALVAPGTEVTYVRGCDIVADSQDGFAEAVRAAERAQVAVVVMGLSQQLEGEENQLLQAVYATGTPVVLVLLNGSALSINWATEHVPAILEAWYPGQAGGTAVAEALFGLTNPGGRLPITFYRSIADLPAFDDYSMENRTYRYFKGEPLFPFGFGLSYTTFAYRNLQIIPQTVERGEPVDVQVEVENVGPCLGDEVVQLYLKDVEASLPVPLLQLQGFTRIRLAPGEKQIVRFTLTAEQMSFAGEDGKWVLEPGEFKVWIGGQQPPKTGALPPNVLAGQFVVRLVNS